MLGFVKSRATFKQTHKLTVVDYNYCINSAYENVSMFVVLGEYSGLEDSFFICDEFFGVITSCTPNDGLTTIQCGKIVTIFGRQLVLTEGEPYIEDFMKRVIEDEFKNLSDSVYAMPYINVTITSHTQYSRPVNDNKIWQLEKYISRVKRLFDIYTDITVDNNTLQVTIGKKTVPTHNVDFGMSTFELISETYSSEAVSKISVVSGGTITDYYLFEDGSYGTDPTQGVRVKGKWEFRESADNIGYVFASNMDSHLIQFRTKKKYSFGDKVCVRSNGRVTYTYINQILKDSKDDRYLYKTGQLTETASETISEQGEEIDGIQQELEFNTVKKDGDSDVTGSISVSGSLSSTGDIYENGVKLSDKFLAFPTQYSHSSSWTAWQTGVDKTWTVHGAGVVFLSASVYTDATSDTGNTMSILYHNGAVVAHDENRFTSASGARAASNASIMLIVADGDTVMGHLQSTKEGSKQGMWYALAFGCTLT